MKIFRRKSTTASAAPPPSEVTVCSSRILLISNCQVQPLKHGLANVCRDIVIDTIPVHVVSAGARDATFSNYIERKADYTCVLSVPLSAEFGPLATSAIRDAFFPTPVLSIANIHFDGTLPDICYVGGLNARMPGPIGEYHSKIALLGYLMNMPVAKTVGMYCDSVYERLGYYEAFRLSLDEMARRDAETDIPLGDLLESKVREGNCFLSHNHPTGLLMSAYINKISLTLFERGLASPSGLRLSQEIFINFLAQSVIFPVFPEIAAYHKLPYETSYVFRTATVGDEPSKPIRLEDFVSVEYKAFSLADQTTLKSTWPGATLMHMHGKNAEFQNMVSRL